MKTFPDLEKEEGRQPITYVDGDETGHGFLVLDGGQTSAVLHTSGYIGHSEKENGWFDLTVKAGRKTVILHNAIKTTSQVVSEDSETVWQEQIYPNLVVINAGALIKENRLRSISFQLDKLESFFHYEQIEWQPIFNPSKDTLGSLKSLRRDRRRRHDFFDPSSVYIVHHPKRVFRFKVDGKTYSIHIGISSRGLGWGNVSVQSYPVAEIVFDDPVDLDTAIDAVWAWKRFFSVLSLNPMPVTALDASGKVQARAERADLYMPGYGAWPIAKNELTAIHPATIPLNGWKDRKALASLMEAWLCREPQRGLFRAAMGNVIEDLSTRIAVGDVVALCAGIETLAELDDASPISKADLQYISVAATDAVDKHSIAVSKARVQTVLAQLRRQSLPQRMRQIFKRLESVLTSHDAKRLETAVLHVRNIAAHGTGYNDAAMQIVDPAVSGLLSACALYDLVTCGFDIADSPHITRLAWAIGGLRMFDSRQLSKSSL